MKEVTSMLLCILSYVSYAQEGSKKIQRDTVISIEGMSPNVITLDEMLITGGKDSILLVYNHGDRLINTDQLMHKIPGLDMMRRGNYANEPLLRGLSSERYVVTIDGMRMFGACTDKMDPVSSYIEPNNLSSLNINLDGQSETELFPGSSVSFQLKKAIFNKERPVLAGAGLKFNSASKGFEQLADFNVNKGKVAVRASFVHRKSENYLAGGGKRIRYSQFEKINYMTAASILLSKNRILSFNFLGDDGFNIGYPALPMDVSFAKAKIFSVDYYLAHWKKFDDVEMKVYHNYIDHAMDDTQRDPETISMHMDMPGISSTSGFYIKANMGTFKYRVEGFRSFNRAEMTMYPDEGSEMFMLTYPDVGTISGLSQVSFEKKIGDRISFQTKGNAQYFLSKSNSDFGIQQMSVFFENPDRVYDYLLLSMNSRLKYTFFNNSNLSWVFNYVQRPPATAEKYAYYIFNREDGFDYIGDPAIKKEGTLQNELQYSWKRKGLQANVNLFYYHFQNYILGIVDGNLSVMTPGANGVKFYTNTGNAALMGGEASVMANIVKKFHLMSTVTFSKGWDFENDPLPLIPPLKVNNSLQYHTKKGLFYINHIWAYEQTRVSDKYGEDVTPSFSIINAGATYKINATFGEISLGGGVENILDKYYHEHIDWGNVPRPGRNIYVNIGLKLN